MISSYLGQIILYFLLALLVYVPMRLIVAKAKRLQTTAFHEIFLALFVCYTVVIVSQTLLPEIYLENYEGWGVVLRFQSGSRLLLSSAGIEFDRVAEIWRHCNLVPFRTIASYFSFGAAHPYAAADAPVMWAVNILGNVLFVLPFGLLLPLGQPKVKRWWQVFLCGSVLIVLIEVLQFFIGRAADIDDYILNMIGIMGGYALLELPGVRKLKYYARAKDSKQTSYIS